MDFSRESILQQRLPPRAKHTLQSMGSSWQATTPLSRSQLYCCLLPHPWGIPVGTGSHTADERKGKRCNWDKTKDFFFFFFNRSSLLQIYVVKSNSFQINWAQYLGMWLVYRATKHSVSLGTNGLVLDTNWVLPGPIIFSNIFLLPKCGTVDFGLLGKSYLLAHWWAQPRLQTLKWACTVWRKGYPGHQHRALS